MVQKSGDLFQYLVVLSRTFSWDQFELLAFGMYEGAGKDVKC